MPTALANDFRSELTQRIGRNEPCWFPGLAPLLVNHFWNKPQSLARQDYGTARWLGQQAPDSGTVPLGNAASPIIVEVLPRKLKERFPGLVFADPPVSSDVVEMLLQAISRLADSGAGQAVAALVRSITLLRSKGQGYDCSHSDPTIPFSIMVSVPVGEGDDVIRLAESILHEAMHLQLTLIERYAPIVNDVPGDAYSPWQQQIRPAAGLVHGLYVFSAILDWLEVASSEAGLTERDRAYVQRRTSEIRQEIVQIESLVSSPALTRFGRELCTWLLERAR